MICEFCNGSTRSKMVRRQHWLNGKLYIIENVTAEVCLECGERYFHATVLDQIDCLLQSTHPIKQTLEVEVVSL
jgi:YgiT-type zinc finger domain-containing protein